MAEQQNNQIENVGTRNPLVLLVTLIQLIIAVVTIVVGVSFLGAILNWWDWSDAFKTVAWIVDLFSKE